MEFCVDHVFIELARYISVDLINKADIRSKLENALGGSTFAEIKAKHPDLIRETDEEITIDVGGFYFLIRTAFCGTDKTYSSMFETLSPRRMFKAILKNDGINKSIPCL